MEGKKNDPVFQKEILKKNVLIGHSESVEFYCDDYKILNGIILITGL